MTDPDEGWSQLDRRTIAVTAIAMVGVSIAAGVPTVIGIAGGSSLGVALAWVLPCAALLVVGGGAADELRWRRTRYRVGAERVELRTGVLVRQRRAVQRDRIRSVDITADPLSRLFGLAQVRIGGGGRAGSEDGTIVLQPLSRRTAEELRQVLLDRAPDATGRVDGMLAELDPAWIRYAPLSFVPPALGAAAVGGVLQVSDWFGRQRDVIDLAGYLLRDVPVVGAVALLVAVAVVVGVIGSLGLFVEMWWRYRLEQEPGGTLRVRRGLFTTRSISLELSRLRGVELVEPLGARLAGAARVDAVATGIVTKPDDRTDHKTLLPAAPLAVARHVAEDVLRGLAPSEPVRLTGHPTAARGRRLRWTFAALVVGYAPLVLLGVLLTDVLLHIAWISALVLVPVAVLLALDAYRSLGHGLTTEYLHARSGTVRRATVVLQRRGIIGWTVTQSIFQRRAGLITLTATTAAGAGAYSVPDAGTSEGLTFAGTAVPDLLAPFLERSA